MLETPAGAFVTPPPPDAHAGDWLSAPVPGTVAQALRAHGRFDLDAPRPLGASDWWYRIRLSGSGPRILRCAGLATLAEVWFNGERLLTTENMFTAHDIPLTLGGDDRLDLCFRSLDARLQSGRRGRMRWRVRMIAPAGLRLVRTTVLGRMPGWCPPVHPIGPWRPVTLIDPVPLALAEAEIRTRVEGADGVLQVRLQLNHDVEPVPAVLQLAQRRVTLDWLDGRTLQATLRIPDVALWWPATHGRPALHALHAEIGATRLDLRRVGFRTLAVARGPDGAGFALHVNGVPVFCRGACWTSADLVACGAPRAALARWLGQAVAGGMNMVRVGGTMTYESDAFYDLCDELGVLVWQDCMLANFDYPVGDAAFDAQLEAEVGQFLRRTAHNPSLAVLCGGSEVQQQAAMLGLPETVWRHPLFDDWLKARVERLRPDVPYVANSPSGGALPFQPDSGVSHYYGVGAYQRPLHDARHAQVRFASECLAFANVPCAATLDTLDAPAVHHPRWKAAVPRDQGASWDFEDVRDHYLRDIFRVDPARLRYEDPARYLDASRAISAELMEAVFSEWRRVGSTCMGGLVWQFQDLRAGAGWGVFDALGRPKAAWRALARVWRPVQVLLTDEGLNGLYAHVLNDTAEALPVRLELTCMSAAGATLAAGAADLTLPPRSAQRWSAAALAGHFFDFTYAYRFGPRAHDLTVVRLLDAASGAMLSEAFHLPDRALTPPQDCGLTAETLGEGGDGAWWLRLHAQRFIRYVHIEDPAFEPEDDWFHLAPGQERRIRLLPRETTHGTPRGEVRAVNDIMVRYYGDNK